MLYALENLLAAAVAEALPEGVKVVPGPASGVPQEGERRVEVSASRLDVLWQEAEPLAAREPAFFSRLQRWDADGTQRDFALPRDVQGDIVEVEAPPGRPLSREQDYQVDGTTVRFFRPPARGKEGVVATVRTGLAEGFHERRPCQLRLTVAAWGTAVAEADALLEKALSSVLTRCVGLGTQEAAHLGDSGVRMRLRQPTVLLEGLERTCTQVETRWAPRATARLRVNAELELTVTVGPPESGQRMDELHYQGQVMPPK